MQMNALDATIVNAVASVAVVVVAGIFGGVTAACADGIAETVGTV